MNPRIKIGSRVILIRGGKEYTVAHILREGVDIRDNDGKIERVDFSDLEYASVVSIV
jgi:hypothetical protein